MFFLGIDPGANGAWGMIDRAGRFIASGRISEPWGHEVSWCALEDQGLRHEDFKSPKVIFNLQRLWVNFGMWQGILGERGVPFQLVQPRRWRSFYNLSGIKSAGLVKYARTMFPDAGLRHANQDGFAVALILADFARCQWVQGELFNDR